MVLIVAVCAHPQPGGQCDDSAVADPSSTAPPEEVAPPEGRSGSGTDGVDVRGVTGHRIEISAAWIAACAAVGGALLTVVGAFLGAVITGYYTTAAADRQIAAESQRSTTAFLREQQKAVYAAFLADESELTRNENKFENLLFHPAVDSVPVLKNTDATKGTVGTTVPASDIEQLEQLRKQIPAIFDRVDKGDDSIQLIGSDAVRAASRDLVNMHFQRLYEILDGGPIVGRAFSSFHELEKLENIQIFPSSPVDKFLATARKDLGVG